MTSVEDEVPVEDGVATVGEDAAVGTGVAEIARADARLDLDLPEVAREVTGIGGIV